MNLFENQEPGANGPTVWKMDDAHDRSQCWVISFFDKAIARHCLIHRNHAAIAAVGLSPKLTGNNTTGSQFDPGGLEAGFGLLYLSHPGPSN